MTYYFVRCTAQLSANFEVGGEISYENISRKGLFKYLVVVSHYYSQSFNNDE